MSKYAQNTTCGHTCPWGSADDACQLGQMITFVSVNVSQEAKKQQLFHSKGDI